MKTLFVALSSSYIHTILAARYLAENSPLPVKIFETNVNVPLEKNMEYIKNERPDVVAFSCYIFNILYTKELIKLIKKELPLCKIILGGYEAENNIKELSPFCDHIIKGEGDFSFGKLLEKINNNEVDIHKVIVSEPIRELDRIKSPYTDEYLSLCKTSRVIYFETCRGCPFDCAYCMSSKTHGVRSFSLDRIFADLNKIMSYSPPLVKFVDRTFNYDKKRAKILFSYIIDSFSFSGTRFHFEMAPELFDEELFTVISSAPSGLFQFEIGVQSYNEETLKAVHRKADTAVVDANLHRLINMKNVVIHVDLIAGLPCENKEKFIRGFNRLISLDPDCMQAGFLKILKGSYLEDNSDGYVVSGDPPYEIISSPSMTEDDLKELKRVAEMLDIYYNSGRFKKSIAFLSEKVVPYDVYLSLSNAFLLSPYEKKNFSSTRQCDLLFEYGKTVLNGDDVFTLEKLISEDFSSSGNTRKWHRWIKK